MVFSDEFRYFLIFCRGVIFVSKDITEELNPEQKKAVQHRTGPLLVLAGAGSGKTRVLTHRVAYLIEQYGVDPRNILAVTFTNKAANEMKERVNKLIGGLDRNLMVSTFHSFCVRILRREIKKIGYERNFVIYDTGDQKSLIKRIIKEDLELDIKKAKPGAVVTEISKAKNELITPEEFEDQINDFFRKIVARIYTIYQKRLQENNALDFGDLIMKTVMLLEENDLVREYYQDKYQYILIDEYQDINFAQYRLSQLLAEKHENICVVGDPDQSIYAFRGADIRNILNFEKDYPGARTVKLEQNYRSQENILEAAHSVIAHNESRKEKKLWTDRGAGEAIKVHTAGSGKSEADFICGQIGELRDEKDYQYGDMAILFRTNSQSRLLEEALMKYSIPYQMVSGTKFYDRKEIRDILAYLRVVYNQEDNISLERIINEPKRGIGAGTLGKLYDYAEQNNLSLYQAGLEVDQNPNLSGAYGKRVKNFFSLMEKFKTEQEEIGLLNLLDEIMDHTGYRKKLREKGTDMAKNRLENIDEFYNLVEDFLKRSENNTLAGFLEEVALLADVDNLEDEEPGVVLMTLHAAKGLEFPVVFLAGMEEGIFPHSNSMNDQQEMEEERRLCYVGITRAMDELYLTRARSRRRFGENQRNRPSRFLDEIPEELFAGDYQEMDSYFADLNLGLDEEETSPERRDSNDQKEKELSPNNRSRKYKVGDQVVHPQFGKGEITEVAENHGLELTVKFKKGEPKKLLAKFAPLQKV